MRESELAGVVVLLMTAGFAALEAQEPAASCGVPGGAVVTGTVVDDSTNRPVAGSRVHLLVPLCNTTADEQGRFRFEEARPGDQRLDAGHPGYRRFAPVMVAVGSGDTVRVELRLRPADRSRIAAHCRRALRSSMRPRRTNWTKTSGCGSRHTLRRSRSRGAASSGPIPHGPVWKARPPPSSTNSRAATAMLQCAMRVKSTGRRGPSTKYAIGPRASAASSSGSARSRNAKMGPDVPQSCT